MKMPLKTLYYMLVYAWDHLKEKDIISVDVDNSIDALDLLARVLLEGMNHLFHKGLNRGYLMHGDSLQITRGKIDFANTVSSSCKPLHLYCEFEELDFNVVSNRILKSTLFNLSQSSNLEKRLRQEAFKSTEKLDFVDKINLTPEIFTQIRFDGNTRFYEFLIKVCRLIYDGFFPSGHGQTYLFYDYLQDDKMWKLFQSFIRNFYKHQFQHNSSIRVKATRMDWQRVSSSPDHILYLPTLNTDVTIETEKRSVIIDTKYYKEAFVNRYNSKKLNEKHLYQMFAYIQNYAALNYSKEVMGILLYPTLGNQFKLDYKIFNYPLLVVGIDLNRHWHEIESDLLCLFSKFLTP